MRKFHRWLSLAFGLFLFWIAVTGVLSQVQPVLGVFSGGEHEEKGAGAVQTMPAGFACPPDFLCRPKPREGGLQAFTSFMHHLHSGEAFGPLGTLIAALSGLAMTFFAFSGLWMYVQMWRNRKKRGLRPLWLWS